jgi:6-phosphofructokinase
MLRCLVATVGKDAPGSNAILRAAIRTALRRGMEVLGARRGILGILEENYHRFQESEVAFILGKGGSILGSSDFRVPPGDTATIERLAHNLRRFDLVIVSGGLGSYAVFSRVHSLENTGLTTTMFVPSSIENDFLNPRRAEDTPGSVHAESVGADTAANIGVEAVDRLREQSYLSRTVFLVQVAGAKTNYLPLLIGIACGAHRVYLPRFPRMGDAAKAEVRRLFGESFDPHQVQVKELIHWMESMFERSRKTCLLVVIPHGIPMIRMAHSDEAGEGSREDYESIITSTAPLELTVLRLVDDLVVHFSGSRTVQVRYVALDDLQRGGPPSARDRVLGTLYGEAAVEEFLLALERQDVRVWGHLNLLGLGDVTAPEVRLFRREDVAPLFQGPSPRAGGLDPLPYFRRSRSTAAGYSSLLT